MNNIIQDTFKLSLSPRPAAGRVARAPVPHKALHSAVAYRIRPQAARRPATSPGQAEHRPGEDGGQQHRPPGRHRPQPQSHGCRRGRAGPPIDVTNAKLKSFGLTLAGSSETANRGPKVFKEVRWIPRTQRTPSATQVHIGIQRGRGRNTACEPTYNTRRELHAPYRTRMREGRMIRPGNPLTQPS